MSITTKVALRSIIIFCGCKAIVKAAVSVRSFVDATPNKVGKYKTTCFKMRFSRASASSNNGKVSFTDDHPFDINFNVWGFNVGYLQSTNEA